MTIGFFGTLTIVFIVLKLTGIIAWSWFFILAPVWLPLLIIFVLIVIIGSRSEEIKKRW